MTAMLMAMVIMISMTTMTTSVTRLAAGKAEDKQQTELLIGKGNLHGDCGHICCCCSDESAHRLHFQRHMMAWHSTRYWRHKGSDENGGSRYRLQEEVGENSESQVADSNSW